MNLVNWAESELKRLSDEDDEDGMQSEINRDILDVVKVFANQGHSGFSASYALNLIKRLLAFKPITPLTGEEDEWNDVSEISDGQNIQQNRRCSAVFRENNDNSTAYYLDGKVYSDNGGKTWWTRGGRGPNSSAVQITFPYYVPENPEYILVDPDPE